MLAHKFKDINYVWFLLVFAQLITIIWANFAEVVPLGILLSILIIWFFISYILVQTPGYEVKTAMGTAWHKRIRWIPAAGCMLTILLLYVIPDSLYSSMIQKLLIYTFFMYICGSEGRTAGESAQLHLPQIIPGLLLLLTFPCILVAGSYITAVSQVFFVNPAQVSLSSMTGSVWGNVIVLALMPAIIEEMIFRGYIMKKISGRSMAVILSALCFALLHFNFSQMSYAFVCGLFFAIIVLYTDNVFYTIGLHFLINFQSVIIAYMPESSFLYRLYTKTYFGYAPLNPVVYSEASGWNVRLLLIGGALSIIVFIIFLLLVKIAGNYSVKTDEDGAGKISWKPDGYWLSGSLVCLALAIANYISSR